eukprot:scaffold9301_cov30-Tisochrysis_lutea.AAC.10
MHVRHSQCGSLAKVRVEMGWSLVCGDALDLLCSSSLPLSPSFRNFCMLLFSLAGPNSTRMVAPDSLLQ